MLEKVVKQELIIEDLMTRQVGIIDKQSILNGRSLRKIMLVNMVK